MFFKSSRALVRSMRRPSVLGALFSVAALVAFSAMAHHSYAMFDTEKTVELKGTVKEFRWTNPHSWILLTTRDASGNMVDIDIEANGPGYLVRQGWQREIIKPGDQITASMNPLRDGSAGGSLIKVVLQDGRVLHALPQIAGPGQAK